jgi:site-specific DNA-cytosine methylase
MEYVEPPWKRTWMEQQAASDSKPERPAHLWKKGQSGNPAGRAPGEKGIRAQLREQLDQLAPEVQDRVVAASRAGDMEATFALYDRLVPRLRPQAMPVTFAFDKDKSLREQGNQLFDAMASGHIDPDTCNRLSDCLAKLAGLGDLEAFLEERQRLMSQHQPPIRGGVLTR